MDAPVTAARQALSAQRRPQVLAAAALPGLVRPGAWVFVPGSSGAPQTFMTELFRHPDHTEQARVITTYVPGINKLDLSQMHASGRVAGLFSQPGATEAQRAGQFGALPMSYAGFARYMQDQLDLDLAVVQVAAPDRHGQCSLGPMVEFNQLALGKAKRRLALINRQTPVVPGSPSIPYEAFDYVCEVDEALPVYDAPADAGTEQIAHHVASLIGDGVVLQAGLGKVPTALMRLLTDRRGLRLHSGMVSDGLLDLAQAGALDMSFMHTTAVVVGSNRLYEAVQDFSPLRVLGCEFTHSPQTLLGLERFVAVNSALEIDLFGQCNLENANGRAISGPGGAPDFARAGRLSPHGCSIVAMQASHPKGSRIVPSLGAKAMVSLPRVDVSYVVTEFGVANLTGASVHERAEAIIEVAAPEYRSELRTAWQDIAARL